MQYRYRWLLVTVGAAILLYTGCDAGLDGDFNENQPPETFLTVDEINLEDENRLSSQINVSWWGNDPDGFITGFEVAVGDPAEDWTFTTNSDSTFLLPITPGREFDDVRFSVRAVDDEEARDPDPASVVFPVKNTPPTVELNIQELPPDSTFNIVSFGWTIGDPDGRANLLKAEIAFNDSTAGSWIEIPLPDEEDDIQFITLVINDEGTETANAEIFLGKGFRSSALVAEGIMINSINEFFVRTTDQAEAESEIASTEWYVKRQNSNILVLNDDGSLLSEAALNFHSSAIRELGFDFDVWNITDGQTDGGRKVRLSSAFPSVVDPTLQLTLAQWDFIYWFSNDINRNITFAQEILSDFFDGGGKLFATIPMTSLSPDDLIFSFLPVNRLASLPQFTTSFLLQNGTEVSSVFSGPTLKTSQRLTTIVPMEPIGAARALYEADFRVRRFDGSTQDFDGVEYISIFNSEENFIFFGMDLQTINTDNNVPELLQNLLIDELGFE